LKNILLKIEYDGTDYQGWQRQRSREHTSASKRGSTVQEAIEGVLEKILQDTIHIIASGRTDAGVHAHAQYANFKTATTIPLTRLKAALNSLLPADIRVTTVKYVEKYFHARYAAKSKVYRYTILNRTTGTAFYHKYIFQVRNKLDVAAMKQAAAILRGTHDFKSFQAALKKPKETVRSVKRISVKKDNSRIIIDIEANGFLYNMVRIIVGTLIEVGLGKRPPAWVRQVLLAEDRRKAGPTAPAKGLCLLKVRY